MQLEKKTWGDKIWERVVGTSCWSRAAVVTRCSYTKPKLGRYVLGAFDCSLGFFCVHDNSKINEQMSLSFSG